MKELLVLLLVVLAAIGTLFGAASIGYKGSAAPSMGGGLGAALAMVIALACLLACLAIAGVLTSRWRATWSWAIVGAGVLVALAGPPIAESVRGRAERELQEKAAAPQREFTDKLSRALERGSLEDAAAILDARSADVFIEGDIRERVLVSPRREMLQVFLEHGMKPHPMDFLLLVRLPEEQRLTTAALLREHGGSCSPGEGDDHSPLGEAAANGDRAAVEFLVLCGADANKRGRWEEPVLFGASLEIAEFLIEHGADVDARDEAGSTPLRRAVERGDVPRVKLLVAHGADPELADGYGLRPRDLVTEDRFASPLRAELLEALRSPRSPGRR